MKKSDRKFLNDFGIGVDLEGNITMVSSKDEEIFTGRESFKEYKKKMNRLVKKYLIDLMKRK